MQTGRRGRRSRRRGGRSWESVRTVAMDEPGEPLADLLLKLLLGVRRELAELFDLLKADVTFAMPGAEHNKQEPACFRPKAAERRGPEIQSTLPCGTASDSVEVPRPM